MLSAEQPVTLQQMKCPASFLNWNTQDILYLQDSESLSLDTSVKYTFEANARQVQGTDKSNVSSRRCPQSTVDVSVCCILWWWRGFNCEV